jgi:hypothetical protein
MRRFMRQFDVPFEPAWRFWLIVALSGFVSPWIPVSVIGLFVLGLIVVIINGPWNA